MRLNLNKDKIMQDHEKLFSQYLATRGLRLTQPRRLILNAVFALHEHFNAEQLYDRMRILSSDVSRATIYRTLPLMMEAGLIQHSLRFAARDVYEHILGHPKHLHWICRKCGNVTETSLSAILPKLEEAAKEQHFMLEDYNLNLRGLCWKCRQSETESQ